MCSMEPLYMNGGKVALRAPEPEDVELMYRIENSPELWTVSNTTVPYSRYVLRQYIETVSNDLYKDRQLRLVIESRAQGRAVGMIDLIDFNPLHNRAEVGIAVEKACREQGMGRCALDALVAYSFRYLHLHQLYAYVAADNAACRKLFAASGFAECAVLHHWLRGECGYRDAVFVQLLSPAAISGKPF